MDFATPAAEIFVPDGLDATPALARTTHLAIGAHQDDLEIMAIDGILQCFRREAKWFSGVIMTNGSGSPRAGLYGETTNEEMMGIRVAEQKKAAMIGDYAAQVFLNYPSSAIKDGGATDPVADLVTILEATRPDVVYTHNLADKHLTHVGVAVKVIRAVRELKEDARPSKLYGCEVWRGLDWMLDDEKVAFDCSAQTNVQNALLGVFDSQVSGGKRYDLAAMGRRMANATYHASHDVDVATGLAFAMDLRPLIEDPTLGIQAYAQGYLDRLAQAVSDAIGSVL